MSIPAKRTALRELDIRVTSPSSVRQVSAISSPMPYWVISAWQPSLVASDPAQRALQLVDLALERVDHCQRDRDPLDGVRWQIDAGKELTAGRA